MRHAPVVERRGQAQQFLHHRVGARGIAGPERGPYLGTLHGDQGRGGDDGGERLHHADEQQSHHRGGLRPVRRPFLVGGQQRPGGIVPPCPAGGGHDLHDTQNEGLARGSPRGVSGWPARPAAVVRHGRPPPARGEPEHGGDARGGQWHREVGDQVGLRPWARLRPSPRTGSSSASSSPAPVAWK